MIGLADFLEQNRDYDFLKQIYLLKQIYFLTKDNKMLRSERKQKISGAHPPLKQNTCYAKVTPKKYYNSADKDDQRNPKGNHAMDKRITTFHLTELYFNRGTP